MAIFSANGLGFAAALKEKLKLGIMIDCNKSCLKLHLSFEKCTCVLSEIYLFKRLVFLC